MATRGPISDHIPLSQEDFRGLYARGTNDTAPDNFATDTLNTKFAEGDVLTRDGLTTSPVVTKSNIVRFFVYDRIGETSRTIILDTSGRLFDSLAPGTPIWTDATIVDFSMVNYGNKAYITVHNREKGIAGKYVLVYEGTGNARQAAGAPPTGFIIGATDSVSVGKVETGYHIIGVCNITSSGFITAPGPVTGSNPTFTVHSCAGGFKLNLTNVAVGPTGTVARILVATKSIPTSGANGYNGNQYGYELFFVPSGIIADNTTTTATIDFYDADLADSADYLIDNLTQIPAGLGLIVYSNRLGVWAEDGNQFTIRFSEAGQPEVFSSVTGFITIDASDAGTGIKNCNESRKTLIIATGKRLYATVDNGNSPNSWQVDQVDRSSGTSCFGFATVLDARGSNTDRLFYADPSGLIAYEGYVKRPELSWNIEDIWKRINKVAFNKIQMIDDPTNHRLFVSVPLDAATSISHVMYADYSKAYTIYGTLQADLIKWSLWTFPTAVVSMSGIIDPTTKTVYIYFALAGGNIYSMKSGNTNDFGNAIPSFWKSSLKTARNGWVNHFGAVQLRVRGSGNLVLTAYGLDDNNPIAFPAIAISATPGREYTRLINYMNERCSIKFSTVNADEYFILSRFTLWAKELWLMRAS